VSLELLTILLFGCGLIALASGAPIAFGLGSVGLIFSWIFWGSASVLHIVMSAWATMNNFLLIAVPLFVLMANVLTTSRVSEDLYTAMHHWMGPLRGGLEVGTITICAIFAAMSGISAVGVVTMGLIALPEMLKRKHDKYLALGAIAAGGALGVLIPPSIIMVVYGSITGVSVGKLFMGGVFPGILLAVIYIIYAVILSYLRPEVSLPVPKDEILPFRERLLLLKGILAPGLLIILVLGVIYFGVCTPTEAAGIGAIGAIILSAIGGRLTWKNAQEAAAKTFRITCMVVWIIIGVSVFTHLYEGMGAVDQIGRSVLEFEVNRWIIIAIMQLILFFLGCFLDPMGILMITIPIFNPIVVKLGFDPIWFGIVVVMNMEMAYLTPPFGFNLFYLKGVVPPEISMKMIYRAVVPFIALQAFGLFIVCVFPDLALWLPGRMMR